MESLVEQLNGYAKNGVPSCQIYPQGQCESLDALYKLEGDWRDIIDYSGELKKTSTIQFNIWQILNSVIVRLSNVENV